MRRTPDIAQLPAPTRIQANPSGGERHEQAIREPGNTSMWGPGNPNRREARERERSALRAAPRTRHGNSTSTSKIGRASCRERLQSDGATVAEQDEHESRLRN